MEILLFIGAIILAILGIGALLDGAILWGIILLIAAAAVGPGGWSITRR